MESGKDNQCDMMKQNLKVDNNPVNFNQRKYSETSHMLYVRNQSYSMFNRVRAKGNFRRFITGLHSKSCDLLSLSDLMPYENVTSISDQGLGSIPLSLIIGSENRCKDFDNHFAPLSDRDLERWMSISDLFLLDECIPPVELIQVGSFYFVRDGHHRISVAMALGMEFVDATVIVFNLKSDALKSINKHLGKLVTSTIYLN